MIHVLINLLYKVFPLYPIPDPQGLLFPNDWEAQDDCEMLKGRSWEEIKSKELSLHWTVYFWLEPKYFHYYIAAVIYHSLQEIQTTGDLSKMELPADTVLSYIALGDVFDEKWRYFSCQQLKFVKIWHKLILKKGGYTDIDFHRNNMNELILRIQCS